MKSLPRFSVLMSCYANDDADHLNEAIASLYNSTVLPDEVVLVVDGEIGVELEVVLSKWQSLGKINVHRLEENCGLGGALRYGLSFCAHDLVARMDSDDVNQCGRFEAQLMAFRSDSALVVDFENTPAIFASFSKTTNKRSSLS